MYELSQWFEFPSSSQAQGLHAFLAGVAGLLMARGRAPLNCRGLRRIAAGYGGFGFLGLGVGNLSFRSKLHVDVGVS